MINKTQKEKSLTNLFFKPETVFNSSFFSFSNITDNFMILSNDTDTRCDKNINRYFKIS